MREEKEKGVAHATIHLYNHAPQLAFSKFPRQTSRQGRAGRELLCDYVELVWYHFLGLPIEQIFYSFCFCLSGLTRMFVLGNPFLTPESIQDLAKTWKGKKANLNQILDWALRGRKRNGELRESRDWVEWDDMIKGKCAEMDQGYVSQWMMRIEVSRVGIPRVTCMVLWIDEWMDQWNNWSVTWMNPSVAWWWAGGQDGLTVICSFGSSFLSLVLGRKDLKQTILRWQPDRHTSTPNLHRRRA